MDVHNVTLADWRDIHAQLVALLILIQVDNGDDLLLLEVEDVRLARHIECAGLGGCHAVDDEARLIVGQGVVVSLINNDTSWNYLTLSIPSSSVLGTSGASLDAHGGDILTLAILIDGVRLAAIIIVGLQIDRFVSKLSCLISLSIQIDRIITLFLLSNVT